ncbi:hypothetical protein HDF26_002326 [Pedobacter cryoconitis]|uniref:hypothetical protein n=1 Tax=Pedobacter cryoconitis TaxID=188932 RepID=UPI00160F3B3C|nr:hypothetical protein [Pedobacter cryoconitis]MBB6271869.1 hypothetical protein [Pedobacter cryoconitis]
MKKHLLTAALAIVAIGGVFVVNANAGTTKRFANYSYTDGTGCHNITSLPDSRCGSGPLTCKINNATVFNGTCNNQGVAVLFHL